jgi:hypothetical protein
MADPLTLAAVGAAALTEGIKFLYAQAGEVLKRWRERKAANVTVVSGETTEPVEVELPASAFDGRLESPRLDLEAVGRLEGDLRALRAAVADYAQGIDEVDRGDRPLLEAVDGLRQVMEAVYGQQITFVGEQRPPSSARVVGEAKVDEVLGYLAGLRAKRILSGSVTGRLEAKRVGPDAVAVGLDVDTIGDRPPGEAGPSSQR